MFETLPIFILLIPCCLTFRAPNVGTTLFTESDLTKQCWDSDSISLLHSRMFLELLLPCPRVLYELDNEFASDLIKYFSLILTTMHSFPDGRKKQLSIYAMEDIIGGYFHSLLLPIARFSYYAGIINWRSMRKLNRYYNQLKEVLRTEGQGWAPPRPQNWENYDARRLPMRSKAACLEGEVPCSNIRLYRRLKCCDELKTCGRCMKVAVPVPFFDCKMKPHAMAVPFKNCPIFDVNSARSAYVLIRFYVQSYRCLYCKCNHGDCLRIFRNNFYTWLVDEVVPRFNDDKTYVAFGGVIRLLKTLECQGVKHVDLLHERQCYNRMAGVSEDPFIEYTRHKLKVILIALLVVLLLWFLLASCIICCRMARKRCTCGKPARSESSKSGRSCPPRKSSTLLDKILGEKGRRRKLWCSCGSKTYYSLTDDTSRGKTSSPKSEDSSPKSVPSSPTKSSSPRTYFSSDSQSRSSRGDVQVYSAAEESASNIKAGSTSAESRGLPPIVEMSERSSAPESKGKVKFGPSAARMSATGDSVSGTDKQESGTDLGSGQSVPGKAQRSIKEDSLDSGKSGSIQADSQAHCYSDESDAITEGTGRTDISSDSIEQIPPR
ncbi:uncharacterized protein LOC123316481 isoform X2 [Coccinella septempunctata]|uniref:uncharacterized protein LOC123316481 isoform X2 n=1 Tax=Coccinella septempunctata TaxID=41139 RepID=UPI001D081666|nr:uncharacterized protein LOC123316481 isoform X2 [Coccinella septempunctata]